MLRALRHRGEGAHAVRHDRVAVEQLDLERRRARRRSPRRVRRGTSGVASFEGRFWRSRAALAALGRRRGRARPPTSSAPVSSSDSTAAVVVVARRLEAVEAVELQQRALDERRRRIAVAARAPPRTSDTVAELAGARRHGRRRHPRALGVEARRACRGRRSARGAGRRPGASSCATATFFRAAFASPRSTSRWSRLVGERARPSNRPTHARVGRRVLRGAAAASSH